MEVVNAFLRDAELRREASPERSPEGARAQVAAIFQRYLAR